jgi:hypothetical protein
MAKSLRGLVYRFLQTSQSNLKSDEHWDAKRISMLFEKLNASIPRI